MPEGSVQARDYNPTLRCPSNITLQTKRPHILQLAIYHAQPVLGPLTSASRINGHLSVMDAWAATARRRRESDEPVVRLAHFCVSAVTGACFCGQLLTQNGADSRDWGGSPPVLIDLGTGHPPLAPRELVGHSVSSSGAALVIRTRRFLTGAGSCDLRIAESPNQDGGTPWATQ